MSGSLNGGSIRVLWDVDDNAEVIITNTSGAPVAFTVDGAAVSFPYTLSSSTTFTTAQSGRYEVSVKHHGIEIANTPDGTRFVNVSSQSREVFAPTADATPTAQFTKDLFAGLSATFAPKAVQRRLPPRFAPKPESMTTPPTVVPTAGAGALATYDTLTPTDPLSFLVHGPTLINYNGWGFYYPQRINNAQYGGSSDGVPWALEFDHDGQKLDIQWTYYGASTKYRLIVDGKATPVTTVSAGQGGTYFMQIDFGSRAIRRVKLEMEGLMQVREVRREKTATVFAAPRVGLTALVLSDSFAAGTKTDTRFTNFTAELGRRMGWGQTIASGAEGTGYLRTSGIRPKLRDRVQTDVIDQAPDVVVVAAGYNDSGAFAPTQIEAEAGLLFADIRAGLPDAELIVVSPWWRNGTPDTNILNTAAAIEAAAATAGAQYVDLLSPCIWTGTGNAGAPNGTGNADVYVDADGTHPTQAGSDYIGAKIAELIHAENPWGPH